MGRGNQPFSLSANMVLDADRQIGCDANTTMATHDCERILAFAGNYCDPNSGDTHGASTRTDCIAYVSISRWIPWTPTEEPGCSRQTHPDRGTEHYFRPGQSPEHRLSTMDNGG